MNIPIWRSHPYTAVSQSWVTVQIVGLATVHWYHRILRWAEVNEAIRIPRTVACIGRVSGSALKGTVVHSISECLSLQVLHFASIHEIEGSLYIVYKCCDIISLF